MLLPAFFPKLSLGLKLVAVGVVIWLIGTFPLLVYLLAVRLGSAAPGGPGIIGAFGFAANVAALVLVIGGIVRWLKEGRARTPAGD